MEQGERLVRGLLRQRGEASLKRFCSGSTYDLPNDKEGFPLLSASGERPLT